MAEISLDDIDRGILHMLQEDARNHVASYIAEAVGVSPNMVRNRIERLEKSGVIENYHPQIDYELAGYQLRVLFLCTVPIRDRRDLADRVLTVEGVVKVTEILSGHHNLTIEVIGVDTDDITFIAQQIEDLGIGIRDERLIKRAQVVPFAHFGRDVIED